MSTEPRDYLAELEEAGSCGSLSGVIGIKAQIAIGQQLRRIADALTPVAEVAHSGACQWNHGGHGPRCWHLCECGKGQVKPEVERPEPVTVGAVDGKVSVSMSPGGLYVEVNRDCPLTPAEARHLADALNAHAAWIEAQR